MPSQSPSREGTCSSQNTMSEINQKYVSIFLTLRIFVHFFSHNVTLCGLNLSFILGVSNISSDIIFLNYTNTASRQISTSLWLIPNSSIRETNFSCVLAETDSSVAL